MNACVCIAMNMCILECEGMLCICDTINVCACV